MIGSPTRTQLGVADNFQSNNDSAWSCCSLMHLETDIADNWQSDIDSAWSCYFECILRYKLLRIGTPTLTRLGVVSF